LASPAYSALARAAIASANQASLSAFPVASRVAVREHSRLIAARTMTSGNGTRSAVPMMVDAKFM
jgi:hypothetical protein